MIADYSKYCKKNSIVIFIFIVIGILCWGFEITNWTMTIDEEVMLHQDKIAWAIRWIGDGRWGITIIKLLLPTNYVLPFFNGFLSMFLLLVSASIIAFFIYSKEGTIFSQVVAGTLFLSCPILAYYLMFDTFSVELSLGILFSIISAVELGCYNVNRKTIVTAILLLTLSIGIYQSLMFVYISMVSVVLLINIYKEVDWNNREYFKIVIRYVLILLISLLFYIIISKVLERFVYDFDYVDGYFRWSYWDISTCIREIFIALKKNILTPEKFYWGGCILYISYIFLVLSLVGGLLKYKDKALQILLSFFALLISIAGPNIAMGGPMPIRTYQAVSIFIFAGIILFIEFVANSKHIFFARALAFLGVIMVLYQSAYVTSLFFSEDIREKNDEAKLNRILSDVEELNVNMDENTPLVIVGNKPWNGKYKISSEQFDLSMFATGQISRLYSWMLDLGYTYSLPNNEQQIIAEEIAQQMPEWPLDGSVIYDEKNSMVIVNIGFESQEQ